MIGSFPEWPPPQNCNGSEGVKKLFFGKRCIRKNVGRLVGETGPIWGTYSPRWCEHLISRFKNSFPYCFSRRFFIFYVVFASFLTFLGFAARQRWPPAQSDPLLDVVGQAGPEHFHQHFDQTA